MRRILTAIIFAAGCGPAAAGLSCTANDTSAVILASPDPDDIHPDWDGSTIGLSWTFEAHGRPIANEAGRFLQGDLISPKGAVVTSDVFIVAREWSCERVAN